MSCRCPRKVTRSPSQLQTTVCLCVLMMLRPDLVMFACQPTLCCVRLENSHSHSRLTQTNVQVVLALSHSRNQSCDLPTRMRYSSPMLDHQRNEQHHNLLLRIVTQDLALGQECRLLCTRAMYSHPIPRSKNTIHISTNCTREIATLIFPYPRILPVSTIES